MAHKAQLFLLGQLPGVSGLMSRALLVSLFTHQFYKAKCLKNLELAEVSDFLLSQKQLHMK